MSSSYVYFKTTTIFTANDIRKSKKCKENEFCCKKVELNINRASRNLHVNYLLNIETITFTGPSLSTLQLVWHKTETIADGLFLFHLWNRPLPNNILTILSKTL